MVLPGDRSQQERVLRGTSASVSSMRYRLRRRRYLGGNRFRSAGCPAMTWGDPLREDLGDVFCPAFSEVLDLLPA